MNFIYEFCIIKVFNYFLMKRDNVLGSVWRFYVEGFRSMTVGRKLWALIIIKLIVFFAVLRLFFFHDILGERYDTDAERANAVRYNLTK